MAETVSREDLEAEVAELRHRLISAQMAAEGWREMYEEASRSPFAHQGQPPRATGDKLRRSEGRSSQSELPSGAQLRRWTIRDLFAGAAMFAIFCVLWVLSSLRIIPDPGPE